MGLSQSIGSQYRKQVKLVDNGCRKRSCCPGHRPGFCAVRRRANPHGDPASMMTLVSPDNQRALIGAGNNLFLFSWQDEQLVRLATGSSGEFEHIGWLSDGSGLSFVSRIGNDNRTLMLFSNTGILLKSFERFPAAPELTWTQCKRFD